MGPGTAKIVRRRLPKERSVVQENSSAVEFKSKSNPKPKLQRLAATRHTPDAWGHLHWCHSAAVSKEFWVVILLNTKSRYRAFVKVVSKSLERAGTLGISVRRRSRTVQVPNLHKKW